MPGKTLLPSEELARYTSEYTRTDKQDAIPLITLQFQSIIPDIEDVNKIISTIVTAQVIEVLQSNSDLNIWVKKGLDLHAGKSICEFCGGTFREERVKELNNHFSVAYNDLIRLIDRKIEQLKRQIVVLQLKDAANYYTELQGEYLSKKIILETEVATYNEYIGQLIVVLEEKKQNAFESPSELSLIDNSNLINDTIIEINLITDNHNIKTNQFDNLKAQAYDKLMDNHGFEFATSIGYDGLLNEIAEMDQKEIDLRIQLRSIVNEISEINSQISETAIAAGKTNEYLEKYFNKDDIHMKVTADNKFQLLRGDIVAKNLSEGEKTAIAFCYFMTRLKDTETDFVNSIVYIDDPVSSLDSNHLFNTYAFIKDQFYHYDAALKKHCCNCAQFFISTHNFEFFNLIKDWFTKTKKADHSFYQVIRTNNATGTQSTLSPLSEHLTKFKSEYSYLFSVILEFKNNPTLDFEQLYNLPNILRRFIESFTAFKYLSTKNIEENIEKIITDAIECERVRKFVHYHSHNLSTSRMEMFSDISESTSVVDIILNSIEAADPVHYSSLKAENIPETATI